MKAKVGTYSIYICEKELNHLQKNHPCLLAQAYSYGSECNGDNYHFYHQPKTMVGHFTIALKEV